ncbi:MAG: hypothetical protein QM308_09470 [Bacillota bacterium]|nr:hypothetical protein [Bacillota bacterium]
MKRTIAALMTALMLLTFLPLAAPAAQAQVKAQAQAYVGTYNGTVRVAQTTSSTSLKISWTGVSGATYHVWRSTDLRNWYYIRTTYSASMTDNYLRSGTRYFYTIDVEMPDGSIYEGTRWGAGVPMGTTRMTSITSPGRGRVKIVWARTAGASGYMVQMATRPYGNYRTKRITPGNTVTFSGVVRGVTLYFRVIPYKRIYGTTYAGYNSNYGYIRLPR